MDPVNIAINFICEAIVAVLEHGSKTITSKEVIKELKTKKNASLERRIERTLAGDDRLFDNGNGVFYPRAVFFKNYEFLITPDEWEIENGVLFPGHRFAACINEQVFPSEVKLGKTEMTEITAPLSRIFHYHLLLGSDEVFDFFAAESPANATMSKTKRPEDLVTLNVYKLEAFYKKHKFSTGDALLCKVQDWEKGEVEFTFLSADDRKASELKDAVRLLEDAVGKVVERFENYAEIPEQLAYACFLGRDFLPPAPKSASLDEFLRRTTRVEINVDSDFAVLAMRQTDDSYPVELPEGVAVSRGETSEITAILKEIGSPLTPVEIDSYILDCCYLRELDFEEFFARAFGREKLHFADEGQQAVFYNYAEERFEELTGSYNRTDDELKAPLRSAILETVDERLAFFDYLSNMEREIPEQGLRQLAEISMQLDEILRMLNNIGYTPDAGDLDRLAETVEHRADDQEQLISELSKEN